MHVLTVDRKKIILLFISSSVALQNLGKVIDSSLSLLLLGHIAPREYTFIAQRLINCVATYKQDLLHVYFFGLPVVKLPFAVVELNCTVILIYSDGMSIEGYKAL